MFAKYYKALTPQEKREFCAQSMISIHTVRNHYVKEDPLQRTNPKPETIARMIIASQNLGEFKLNVHGLRQYFFDDIVLALLSEVNIKH